MTCCVGSSHYSYHPAKFVDIAPFESQDKNIFDLSRDHLTDVSHDFVGRIPFDKPPPYQFSTPYPLIPTSESGDIMFTTISKCHLTLRVGSSHPKPPLC